jgi:hypothetical protein
MGAKNPVKKSYLLLFPFLFLPGGVCLAGPEINSFGSEDIAFKK